MSDSEELYSEESGPSTCTATPIKKRAARHELSREGKKKQKTIVF